MEHYRKAVELQPANADILSSMAWVLATRPEDSVRNGAQAVVLAQQADQLSGSGNAWILGTLAAAYAENGRFPEALSTAQRALEVATVQSKTNLVNLLRTNLGLDHAGSPFRDTSQLNPAPATRRPSD